MYLVVQNSVAERRIERLKLENETLEQRVSGLQTQLLEMQQRLDSNVLDLQTKVTLTMHTITTTTLIATTNTTGGQFIMFLNSYFFVFVF